MKRTKLKDLLNESVLGQLPSSQMFKYNKATGTYEAPGSHSTNEEIEDQLAERMSTEKKIGDSVTLADGDSATIVKRMGNHKYAVKTDSGKNKVINIDTIREDALTEGKNDFMARGMNTNIHVKNQPNADISEKIYTELITFMKKHKVSPKEITFKF